MPPVAFSLFRKGVLGFAATTLVCLGGASAFADTYPDKPLTIVVPASTGGTNDRAARVMANFLSEELGQPVTVVNRPGGGNLLGHLYFQNQPADGYVLLRTTVAPYITINQLVQGADFKIEDFQPINLPDLGTSIIATSNDSRFSSIDQLIAEIRTKPGTVSVGVQPTATDNINFQVFLKTLGLPPDAVRLVTYDSGGPVRTGIIGGQFDVGVVGDQGMGPRKGQFRPLMSFSKERSEVWNAPTVVEVMKAQGVDDYPRILSGSLQGYLTHTELKSKYPERYARLVQAFESISNNPEAIKAVQAQDLSIQWIGPDRSWEILMQQHRLLSDPELLEYVRPE
jgi:putative tricarboxylic transport membrane protein